MLIVFHQTNMLICQFSFNGGDLGGEIFVRHIEAVKEAIVK